ncbi:hypothetical protein J6590_100148 [Homalodisca vitripennis]|nr:hypothetical protein J6590_100148 [Homalodisca vitripennis]
MFEACPGGRVDLWSKPGQQSVEENFENIPDTILQVLIILTEDEDDRHRWQRVLEKTSRRRTITPRSLILGVQHNGTNKNAIRHDECCRVDGGY